MKRETKTNSVKTNKKKRNSTILYYLIAFCLPLLVYISSVRFGFVYLDDDILISDNYEKISKINNIGLAFLTDAYFSNSYPFYRPLLTASLIIDAQFAGKEPGWYHFTNIFLHCFTTLALLWLLGLLGFGFAKSFAGTLIFACHPLASNAVLWLVARNDLLVCLFSLLCLGFYIKYINSTRRRFLVLSSISFALALFSKESGIMLPFVLVVYNYLLSSSIRNKLSFLRMQESSPTLIKGIPASEGVTISKTSNNIIFYLCCIAIIAVWYYLRSISISPDTAGQIGLKPFLDNLPAPAEMFSKFFLPWNLAAMPVFSTFRTFTGIPIIAIIILLIFLTKNVNKKSVLFGFVLFASMTLPNMFARIGTANDFFDYLDCRSYLPMVGILIIILNLIPDRYFDFKNLKYKITLITLIVLLGSTTSFQSQKYRNAETFWNSAIDVEPMRARFQYHLGRYYFKQNDFANFEKYLLAAVKLKRDPEFLYHLGMLEYVRKKNYEPAYNYFIEAFEGGLKLPEARNNFVNLCIESANELFSKGESRKAAARCYEALQNDSTKAETWLSYGVYEINSGSSQKAVYSWQKAISINPQLLDTYRNLYVYFLHNSKSRDSILMYANEYQNRGGKIEQYLMDELRK
ncbi:MAG: hypothetical protein HW421_754 [Ignavibacteria bacterium]|nr:hypothetical protein [Ignavibacteria bacterium]